MGKRSVYAEEKKIQFGVQTRAVEQAQQVGISCAQIARELGVSANLLTRWWRQADLAGSKAFAGTGSPRDGEVSL